MLSRLAIAATVAVTALVAAPSANAQPYPYGYYGPRYYGPRYYRPVVPFYYRPYRPRVFYAPRPYYGRPYYGYGPRYGHYYR